MNLQEQIRKILKEETTLQKNLMGLFKNQGVEVATAAVGGFDNFAKILNLNLDDIDTQEMLVKNFINYTKVDDVEVSFIEVRTSSSGNRIIKIYLETDDPTLSLESWYVNTVCDYMNNKLFPFRVKPTWTPVFVSGGAKIFLDAEIVNEEEDQEEITEKWSEKYKKSINCSNPKGFSQKAHCAGKHKKNEIDEYARTLKNARQQGVGLKFPKSAIKSNPSRFRPYNRKDVNESDLETKQNDKKIVCEKCGWSWDLSDGGDDPYTCHKCGNENNKSKRIIKKKSNLREQQIKEGLPNRTKELILDKIRTMGFDDAASIVGGKDNLSKITGINTYEEYLNLFNDLTISTSQEKPYITLYKNDKGLNVFVIYYEVNSKMSYIFINHNILQKPFSGYNIQKSRVFRKWLKNTYDIEVKNTDFLKAYYPGEENAGGYLEYLT
jgi:DNA-directed RNA polymerase subunit RPC12/RpoP